MIYSCFSYLPIILDPYKAILVSFFFWKPAHSKMLKSISGLLRSVLHDILKPCPELVPAVFPRNGLIFAHPKIRKLTIANSVMRMLSAD
jgi:hypothetical protein